MGRGTAWDNTSMQWAMFVCMANFGIGNFLTYCVVQVRTMYQGVTTSVSVLIVCWVFLVGVGSVTSFVSLLVFVVALLKLFSVSLWTDSIGRPDQPPWDGVCQHDVCRFLQVRVCPFSHCRRTLIGGSNCCHSISVFASLHPGLSKFPAF